MKSSVKTAIRKAWSNLRSATERESGCPFALEYCEAESIKVEKAHRRYVGGEYRVSATEAARLEVLQNVYDKRKPPASWQDAVTTRRDIALCQALRERLVSQGSFDAAFPNTEFLTIEYSEHVVSR